MRVAKIFMLLFCCSYLMARGQEKVYRPCDTYTIDNKYRFIESLPVSKNEQGQLYVTFIQNIQIDELNSLQFSIPSNNKMEPPIFVWVKLESGLYLDLNVTGYAKRLIDEQELPTALVKPPKNVQDLLKEEPAELIKLRYGEDHYIDLFYPLDNPRVFSEMLECVATD